MPSIDGELLPVVGEEFLDEMVKARLRSVRDRAASLRKEIAENNKIYNESSEGIQEARKKIIIAVDKQRHILEQFGDKEKEIQLVEKKIAVAHKKIITLSERVNENNKFVEKVRKENRPGRRLQLEGMLHNEKERREKYLQMIAELQQKKVKTEAHLTQVQERWKYSLKFQRDLHGYNETATKFISENLPLTKRYAGDMVGKIVEQNQRYMKAEKRISELTKKLRQCDYKKDGINDVKELFDKVVVAEPVPLPTFDDGVLAGKYTSDVTIALY